MLAAYRADGDAFAFCCAACRRHGPAGCYTWRTGTKRQRLATRRCRAARSQVAGSVAAFRPYVIERTDPESQLYFIQKPSFLELGFGHGI